MDSRFCGNDNIENEATSALGTASNYGIQCREWDDALSKITRIGRGDKGVNNGALYVKIPF